MDAIVYRALGELGLASIADPEPGPGEVLLRTRASGFCHTDIDILTGQYGDSTFPLVPGHEYSGVVEAVGADVDDFAEGDRVVVDPNFNCGHCRPCRKGLANLCDTLGAYGVSSNGGFAELSVVAARNLVPIGDLSFEIAALAEPMGCVLNGVGAVDMELVRDALIFGAGPIGQLMAMALRSRGATGVSLVDTDESRLELAESFGFEGLAAGSAALDARQREMDLAVDATGVPSVVQDLTRYVANGGTVLMFGVCPREARIEISPYEVFRRQLRLAGAHSLNHNIPAALEAIRFTGADIERLISHKVPLAEIPDFLTGHSGQKTLKVQAVMPG